MVVWELFINLNIVGKFWILKRLILVDLTHKLYRVSVFGTSNDFPDSPEIKLEDEWVNEHDLIHFRNGSYIVIY